MRRVLLMAGVAMLALSGSVALAGHHHGHGGGHGYNAGYRGGYGPACNHGAYGSYYRGGYGPAYGAYYRPPVYVAPAPPVYYGPSSGVSFYTPGFSFSFSR